MAVTNDNLELPLYVGGSMDELALKLRVAQRNLYYNFEKQKKGEKVKNYRIKIVEMGNEDL